VEEVNIELDKSEEHQAAIDQAHYVFEEYESKMALMLNTAPGPTTAVADR